MSYTLDTDAGIVGGSRSVVSDPTTRLTDGATMTGTPSGFATANRREGGWATLSGYSGKNPLTPIVGKIGAGPAIDVLSSMSVLGGESGADNIT